MGIPITSHEQTGSLQAHSNSYGEWSVIMDENLLFKNVITFSPSTNEALAVDNWWKIENKILVHHR